MKSESRRVSPLTRRSFLKASTLGGSATALAAALGLAAPPAILGAPEPLDGPPTSDARAWRGSSSGERGSEFLNAEDPSGAVGDVDLARFDPSVFLENYDSGSVTQEAGRTVRTSKVMAINKDIEVAPGVWFPAWTYNERVPGPTFRARAGDWVRFDFFNATPHPHSIHGEPYPGRR